MFEPQIMINMLYVSNLHNYFLALGLGKTSDMLFTKCETACIWSQTFISKIDGSVAAIFTMTTTIGQCLGQV